jgi:hypothetical protein
MTRKYFSLYLFALVAFLLTRLGGNQREINRQRAEKRAAKSGASSKAQTGPKETRMARFVHTLSDLNREGMLIS